MTSDNANKNRNLSFKNSLNSNLVEYLKQYAWDDDITSANAIYVVLDNEIDKDIEKYRRINNASKHKNLDNFIY